MDSDSKEQEIENEVRKKNLNTGNNNLNTGNNREIFRQQTQTTKPLVYQFHQQQQPQQTLPRPPQQSNHHFPLQNPPLQSLQGQSSLFFQPIRSSSQPSSQPSTQSERFGNHFGQQPHFPSQNFQQQLISIHPQATSSSPSPLSQVPHTEQPNPFSFHQQQQHNTAVFDDNTAESPYLLHQLKASIYYLMIYSIVYVCTVLYYFYFPFYCCYSNIATNEED